MGREIRMVPPNWEHPRDGRGRLQPMFDRTFADAAAEWKAEFAKWEAGERPDYCGDESRSLEYWEWSGTPPDREYHRPWIDAEATWVQIWETVSEGTPVSPPFATREELAAYLAQYGDLWDQKRGDPPWGKAAADALVASGWAPTAAIIDGKFIDSKDVPLAMGNRESDQ